MLFGDDFLKKSLKSFVAASLTSAICLMCFSGCSNKSGEDNSSISNSTKKDYDIFVYNADPDIGTSFRAMCDEYTKRTGVIIRTVTPTEEKNTLENLESYINSDHPPDIFTVNNLSELKKWKDESTVWDFSNATEESFKKVVNSIPDSLRLSSNTSDSFGLPYSTEGYGFVVDPKMISSLFGGEKHRSAQNDLKNCSYMEFKSMIVALNAYINNNTIVSFKLNKKDYSFAGAKGELSRKLTGVFSLSGGETKNFGRYLPNIALSAIFRSAAFTNIATEIKIDQCAEPFLKFTEALDIITSYVSGNYYSISRGAEFISNSKNSTTQAMKNFVNGKSLFLLASTQDYKNLATFNSLVAKRCVFIPIKMDFDSDDIISSTDIAKNMYRSIPVYAPKYYCINAKSSDKEKKAAQDFLTWVQTSDLAQKYIISEFGFTPYDIKESSVIDNPLSRSMIEYLNEGNTLPDVTSGMPDGWCENVFGKNIIDQYLTKISWSKNDYKKISDYGVYKWKELINK